MKRTAHFYRTLVSAAAVDGRITGREALLLQKFRKRLGLSVGEARAIGRRVTGGKPTYFVPQDPAARASLFDDVVKVVEADGAISAKERSFLKKIRARYMRNIQTCPRCAIVLSRPRSRFGCRECGGVWIPGGGLSVLHLNGRVRKWLGDSRRTASMRKGWGGIRCRACRRALDILSIGRREERAFIERCPECRGVFVEVDQRARLMAIVRKVAGLRSRRQLEAQSWALVHTLARRLEPVTSRRGASGPRRTASRAGTRSRPSSAR